MSYLPSIEDHKERYLLYWVWQGFLQAKQYNKADEFRELYREWDQGLGTPNTWFPVFESTKHYRVRNKYGNI